MRHRNFIFVFFCFLSSVSGASPLRMQTILEKTIFHIDVLKITVTFGEADSQRLRAILQGSQSLQDKKKALANEAVQAQEAVVTMRFLRSISFDQFLQGIADNLVHAQNAGYVSEAMHQDILQNLPRWYDFLKQRGVLTGDSMIYKIRGDVLHVVYNSFDQKILLDQTDVGPEKRLSVLGGDFAVGSDFREGLLNSVLSGD